MELIKRLEGILRRRFFGGGRLLRMFDDFLVDRFESFLALMRMMWFFDGFLIGLEKLVFGFALGL
jgi:hypothetical protein